MYWLSKQAALSGVKNLKRIRLEKVKLKATEYSDKSFKKTNCLWHRMILEEVRIQIKIVFANQAQSSE